MNKYAYVGLGLAFLGGVALGAGGGYYFTVKRLNDQYNEKMEEEIQRTKDHYKRVYKVDEYATPQDAAEALGVEAAEALSSGAEQDVEDVTELVKNYGAAFENQAAAEDTGTIFVEQNIFEDTPAMVIDKENRDPSKPYVIDIVEYMDNPNEYEQLELTYYAGDSILGDDKDEPVREIGLTVGEDNLAMFGISDPDQPHIVLIRNERLKTDFQVTHSDGKFAHEVLGFQHSDEPFERTRMRHPRSRREE